MNKVEMALSENACSLAYKRNQRTVRFLWEMRMSRKWCSDKLVGFK